MISFAGRIHPEVVVVLYSVLHNEVKGHLRRFRHPVEGQVDDPHLRVLAQGDGLGTEAVAEEELLAVLDDFVGSVAGAQVAIDGVHHLHGHDEPFVAGVDKLGETGHDDDAVARLTPFTGRGIAFLLPMHIEGTYQGGALTAIVVQAEQLETGIVLGAKVALHLVLIAQHLELSTGMEEFLGLRSHAVPGQEVAEYLEIAGLVGSHILRNLLKVGECAPLPLLVGDDGRVACFRRLVVAGTFYLTVVVVIAAGGMAVPIEATGTALDMIFGAVVPSPSATDAGPAVDTSRVVLVHLAHPVVAIGHPVAGRLVAGSHHHKRGMVAVFIDNALRLLQQVLVDGLPATKPHAMVRPRRSFGLQVDAHLVGSLEGSVGRTVAMEAHMVEAVILAFPEHLQPLLLVGGRIARLGEAAVLHGATQEQRPAVDLHLPSLDADVAQANSGLIDIFASLNGEQIEVGVELVPRLNEKGFLQVAVLISVAIDRKGELHLAGTSHIDIYVFYLLASLTVGNGLQAGTHKIVEERHEADKGHMVFKLYLHLERLQVVRGQDAHFPDIQLFPLRPQFHAACDAIPVTLRLVGHRVRVLSHADVLNAVVDADGDVVLLAGTKIAADIIAVGRGERCLVADLMAVHVDSSLNVWTLQEERHAGAFPVFRHIYLLMIPGCAYIVLPGSEKERELHVALAAIGLHEGVVVIGGVVERPRPRRLQRNGQPLVVGKHRSGQHDEIAVFGAKGRTLAHDGVAHGKIPGTGQADDALRPCGDKRQMTNDE